MQGDINVKSHRYIKALVVFCACALAGFLLVSYTGAAQGEPLTIRWLIAHEPVEVFDRAKDAFASEFEKETGRKVVVIASGPSDYGVKKGEVVPTGKVFDALDNGDVDVVGTILTALPSLDLELSEVTTLALPYLFDGYDDSSRALESESAQHLLDLVSDRTSAHALAFTYSGGLKVIALYDKKISDATGLIGARIGTPNGKLSQDTLAALKAEPVFLDPRQDAPETDGMETTYTRIFTRLPGTPASVLETYHSLFFTVVLASDSFYDSLSPAEQRAFNKAMKVAAAVEREDSIALGEENKRKLKEAGTNVIELTPAMRQDLRTATAPLYEKFSDVFPPALVKALRDAGQR